MTDPITALHYTANGNFLNGVYAPGADGFNLADVGSVSELNALPPGVKGLVYLGLTNGADANFQATVSAFIGNPNLYGFYIADEPGPALAANLKAEADWIHANVPGAKTFMVEENMSSNTSPVYDYAPANTDIDLFGLDPYPVQTNVPNNLDYNILPLAVSTAEADGVPQADIVPVYQAFGGGQYTTYILPTAAQEDEILSTWGSVIPDPAFDYAYSWGVQVGDTAISDDPALQTVFASHNAGGTTPPPPPPPPPAAPTITIADASLTVEKRGGTVSLGISETAPAGATDVTAKITGLPSYETIKDKLDGKTFSGSSITLSEAEVDSGLTLTSNYRGSGHPVATLTVTGSDLVGGVAATSAPQSIKVTDPGPSWSNDVANLLGGGAVGFNQPTESYDYLRVASATIAEPHRG
jgi:hypothetical protein